MLVLAFHLALLLSSVYTSNLETCSSFSDCDKGDELVETKGRMTKSMSLLAANHAERVKIDGGEGIFVSIKTTEKYHETRLPPLVLTWLQTLQPEQVHIVTDVGVDDEVLLIAKQQGIGVIGTTCLADHHRQSLSCKSGAEYDQYYTAREKDFGYRWFCHFDDDVYVNIRELISVLDQYNPSSEPVYLGRWPLSREKMEAREEILSATFPQYKQTSFQYATGAAYCISSFLMDKLEPYCRGEKLAKNCKSLGYPDDVLVGTVIGAVLGFKLTNELAINSNLNGMRRLSGAMLKQQVTISYGEFKFANREPMKNVIVVPDAAFSEEEDPTRYWSTQQLDNTGNHVFALLLQLQCASLNDAPSGPEGQKTSVINFSQKRAGGEIGEIFDVYSIHSTRLSELN